MKKLLSFFFFACLMIASLQAQTADDIIAKHFAAIGGRDKIANIQSLRYTGKMQIMPGLFAPIVTTIVRDKAFRFDMTFQGMTATNTIESGGTGWFIQPFQGDKNAQPMPEEQIKTFKSYLDLTGDLFDYAKKGNLVEYVGEDDVDGTEIYKLKVVRPDRTTIYYCIDKETSMNIAIYKKVKAEGKEIKSYEGHSNFQKTPEGLTLPFFEEGDNGQMQWDKIEVNPKIDMAMFVMPAKK
jgi:hypothetical protein